MPRGRPRHAAPLPGPGPRPWAAGAGARRAARSARGGAGAGAGRRAAGPDRGRAGPARDRRPARAARALWAAGSWIRSSPRRPLLRARRRLRPRRPHRRARRAAHPARPEPAPRRGARGALSRRDRDRLAQDPPQQSAGLFHRGDRGPCGAGARRVRPAPGHGRGRPLQHGRACRAGEQDRHRPPSGRWRWSWQLFEELRQAVLAASETVAGTAAALAELDLCAGAGDPGGRAALCPAPGRRQRRLPDRGRPPSGGRAVAGACQPELRRQRLRPRPRQPRSGC